ncbi:MAG: nucleoside triphosphate pyrophosphohydrolase [Gammaproteobacteria bacterium]
MSAGLSQRYSLQDLLHLMACLRNPQHGCPWDRQQDFATIAPHTLEEVYEVIDAIERQDPAQLKGELGDLLFQIVFYAQLGSEAGHFDFSDIVTAITSKLLHRHPHVFPDATLQSFGQAAAITVDGVSATWEAIKSSEREQRSSQQLPSQLDDVPLALPAVARATKLQKRAAAVGFDWHEPGAVIDKVGEELTELGAAMQAQSREQVAEEFGDLLFSMVNLGRHLHVDPEQALRRASHKFEQRFRKMEIMIRAEGVNIAHLTLEQLESFWLRVKSEEPRSS